LANSSVQWRLANSYGIWMGNPWDPKYAETIADPWNSGHVNDVLVLENGSLVAATDTGGVWLVPADGSPALCLSNSWPYAAFLSLALGIYPRQIYAGGEA